MSAAKITVKELRSLARKAYDKGKGNPKLKNYTKMRKAELAQILGVKVSQSSRFEHKKLAHRVGGLAQGVEEKLGGREQVLKAIKSGVTQARSCAKKEGREATQQELRVAAIAALRKHAAKNKDQNFKQTSSLSRKLTKARSDADEIMSGVEFIDKQLKNPKVPAEDIPKYKEYRQSEVKKLARLQQKHPNLAHSPEAQSKLDLMLAGSKPSSPAKKRSRPQKVAQHQVRQDDNDDDLYLPSSPRSKSKKAEASNSKPRSPVHSSPQSKSKRVKVSAPDPDNFNYVRGKHSILDPAQVEGLILHAAKKLARRYNYSTIEISEVRDLIGGGTSRRSFDQALTNLQEKGVIQLEKRRDELTEENIEKGYANAGFLGGIRHAIGLVDRGSDKGEIEKNKAEIHKHKAHEEKFDVLLDEQEDIKLRAKRGKKKPITSFDQFKKEVEEARQAIDKKSRSGNLVQIYKLREALNGRIRHDKFNEYLLRMSEDGTYYLQSGEMPDMNTERYKASLHAPLGGLRYYVTKH